jgi:hypothetical protein
MTVLLSSKKVETFGVIFGLDLTFEAPAIVELKDIKNN